MKLQISKSEEHEMNFCEYCGEIIAFDKSEYTIETATGNVTVCRNCLEDLHSLTNGLDKPQTDLIETKEEFEMRLLYKALHETREPLCNILSYAADFLRTQNDFNGRGYDRQKADILEKYSDLMATRILEGRK